MKTTENSRIWKYDTQGTENRSTALVPPQASTALTNNASEEKAKGTPIPALVGFHRKTSLGYRVQDLRIRMYLKNQNGFLLDINSLAKEAKH